jgi:hypothetical protein
MFYASTQCHDGLTLSTMTAPAICQSMKMMIDCHFVKPFCSSRCQCNHMKLVAVHGQNNAECEAEQQALQQNPANSSYGNC